MRKSISFIVVIAMLFILGSCGEKKQQSLDELAKEVILKPRMEINAEDSAEVFNLVNMYLDRLRGNQIDEALGMLYVVSGDSIKPLPERALRAQHVLMNRFKGVRYDLERIAYDQEKENLAKYTVTLFEKEEGDPRPNTISFVLNPVRHGAKWYLTLSDASLSGNSRLPN
jgi:hypothetical protein